VRLPSELLNGSPGFYTALSDVPEGAGPLTRFYFNVTAAGAPPLVASITARLNAAGVGFRLKVVNDPAGFDRCDPAVLYVEDGDRRVVESAMAEIAADVTDELELMVPALTQRIRPGVAWAEDDGGAEGFGMRRCMLIAEADTREPRAGILDVRRERVAEAFAEAGMDIGRPWRRPADPAIGPE
jgi:hypothetical protein